MNVLLSNLVFLYPKIAIFYFYVKKNNKIRYYIKDLLSLPKDNKIRNILDADKSYRVNQNQSKE